MASREVEDALFQHDAVAEVAVVGLPDPKWIEAVTAVVVVRSGASVDEGAIFAHAKEKLAYYKIPKRVIFADELPRNASGKILKRELRHAYGGTTAAFETSARGAKPAYVRNRQAVNRAGIRMRLLGLFAAAFAVSMMAPDAARSAEPLKIGVIDDMSSVYADITGKGSVAAAQLAVEDFGGRVLDRDIQLVIADHQNKADVASGIARRWFDAENVQMMTGLGNSAVALAVRGLARERKKVDIVVGAASPMLDNEQCSPTGFHWAYNTYSNSKAIADEVVKAGGKSWFFLTTDYAFGTAIQNDTTRFVEAAGGKVVGSVRMPLGTADFASFLLQAQASKADIVAIAAGGQDLVNAVKQAGEFGIVESGQKIAAVVVFIQDIHSLGPKAAQGLYLAESFYWDRDDKTRAWSEQFEKKTGFKPNTMQAGVYSATRHYLKAVAKAGADDSAKVAEAMKALPVEDFYTAGAKVRADGLAMRDLYLFKVKPDKESKGPWDLYEKVRTISGKDAYWPASNSKCRALKDH